MSYMPLTKSKQTYTISYPPEDVGHDFCVYVQILLTQRDDLGCRGGSVYCSLWKAHMHGLL